MTTDPKKIVLDTEFSGLSNYKIDTFSWSVAAQVIATSGQYTTPLQSFPLVVGSQLQFLQSQNQGLDNLWRTLNMGLNVLYFGSSNNWLPQGINNVGIGAKWYLWMITYRTGNTLYQYFTIKNLSGATLNTPGFTVNIKALSFKAPF